MAAAASTTAGLYGRLNRTSTRGFLAYVAAAGACAAVLACFVISAADSDYSNGSAALRLSESRSDTRVWPDLEFNWRLVVATIVGFLGSAFGTVGGVGGGGIFVPLLNLVLGFDTKSAAALSKCMIMGASASSVWYNLQVSHPTKEAPVIDYKLALLFQPMLMLGITIGVELSVVFPYWLITVLIIILFIGTSSRSFYKGILMWREESRMLMETQERDAQTKSACAVTDDVVFYPSYAEPLLAQHKPTEKSGLETLWFNLSWKNILVLMAAWSVFLVLQILKNNTQACSTFYWVINILQVPAAVSVFLWKAMELCRDSRARRMNGDLECVCEASIEWSPAQLIFCAFCGLLGGTVGGLLGSGGGFILGPLLLELGCIPQVASATATFVMMFSSSLSVVEFYFLGRFPLPYAGYLIFISILAGFWGQCLVRKIVHVLKRASLIVFILSSVIFASALTMGVVGTEKSISMINNHEYMGFLSFCE